MFRYWQLVMASGESFLNILGVLLVIMGFLLLFLQIFAYFNVENSEWESQGNALSALWFLNEGIYNSWGKGACKVARALWVIAIPLSAVWLYLKFS